MTFKVKFFGSKNRKEQIKQVKMYIDADHRNQIEMILHNKYGYEIVHGLRIRTLLTRGDYRGDNISL